MEEFSDVFGNIEKGVYYKNVPEVGMYQYNPDGTSVLLGNTDPNHPLYNEDNVQLIEDVNNYDADTSVPYDEFSPMTHKPNTQVSGIKG